jgi:hypothetical protein
MKPFNNPFQIKDRAPIVLNIKVDIDKTEHHLISAEIIFIFIIFKGGTNLPTQSFQEKTMEKAKELREQFPVSSGSQHRGAENEWRPVSPPTVPPTKNTPSSSTKYMGVSSDKINYSTHTNADYNSTLQTTRKLDSSVH